MAIRIHDYILYTSHIQQDSYSVGVGGDSCNSILQSFIGWWFKLSPFQWGLVYTPICIYHYTYISKKGFAELPIVSLQFLSVVLKSKNKYAWKTNNLKLNSNSKY